MSQSKPRKLRKAEARLAKRIDDFEKMSAGGGRGGAGLFAKMNGRGFHRPGSTKK